MEEARAIMRSLGAAAIVLFMLTVRFGPVAAVTAKQSERPDRNFGDWFFA